VRLAVLALLLASCDAREPLTSCGGDLRGVWRAPGESASGEPRRFQLIAGAWSWELYPMFDDAVIDAPLEEGVLAAPSAIDVIRFDPRATALVGTWSRRYERRDHRCMVARPVLISRCQDDAFTLTASPPPPPLDLETCAAPPLAPPIETRFVRE